MKILFIQQDVFKQYGVMMLSAVLKKAGHKCDILIDSLEKDLMGQVARINPDMVGFSIPSTRYSWMKTLAKEIKAKFNKLIIVGGPHPTFFPEIINEDFVDIACVGEGEEAILELANAIDKKKDTTKIKNLWVKKNGKIYKNPVRKLIEDLDALPDADRDIYKKYFLFRNQNIDIFMASRGCPYNCTFCFNKKYNQLYKGKGSVLRRRSVNSMLDEIKKAVRNNKKISHVMFYDDTFILGPREWFSEFLKRYKEEIHLPFSVTARANLVDEEIIRMLKRAGCNAIRMGIESANPKLREVVLQKGITNEQIIKAARIIKNNRIKLQVYNILGIPGETLDMALETYELSYRINPQQAWCSLMQPFPGTEIMEIAKKQQLIKDDYKFDELDNSYFSTLPLAVRDKNQLCNLQKLFQLGNMLRIPPNTMRKLIRLPQNMLFELIFKATFALGVKKLDNWSWSYMFMVAQHSGDSFRRKKN